MQLGARGVVCFAVQGVEPGQEGRDANAAGDPQLLCLAIDAAQIEATVRAFNVDGLAGRQQRW